MMPGNSSLRRILPARSLGLLATLTLGLILLASPADSAIAQDGVAGPKVISGPAVTSSPQSGDTYRAGEMITAEVTFSEPVTVTGEPRLQVWIGERGRWARYTGADASEATLRFSYVVKAADRDADGVSLKKNALDPNGGKIADAEGNRARLRHGRVGDQAAHKVAGSPEEPEPPPPPPPANSAPQFAGETAARSVSEIWLPGLYVGDPVTAEDGDGDALTYTITDSWSFMVIAGDGQIFVAAGADLDYETQAEYSVTLAVHDGKNAAGEADTSVDDSIQVTISVLNVDEPGTVALDTDVPQSGSAVTASLTDPDGGVSGVTWGWARSAGGSAWTAIVGATGAAYTPNAGADAGKRLRATASYMDSHQEERTASAVTAPVEVPRGPVAAGQPQVATPAITSGPAITSTPASGGAYGKGEAITVTVTYSLAVAVTGTPQLALDIGGTERQADYASISSDNLTLTFSYTVAEGDSDANGISIGQNALALNEGTIKAWAVDANLAPPPRWRTSRATRWTG